MPDTMWTFHGDDERFKRPAIRYGLEMLWWWISWPYRVVNRFFWVRRCIRDYGTPGIQPNAPGGFFTYWRQCRNVKDVVWLPRTCDLKPRRFYTVFGPQDRTTGETPAI